MPDDPVAALEEALGAPPPRGVVEALSGDDLDRLAALIQDARRSQRQALRRATDESLRHVPFPLRLAVKKVLR